MILYASLTFCSKIFQNLLFNCDNVDNLGIPHFYAFEILHLGKGEILHQRSIYWQTTKDYLINRRSTNILENGCCYNLSQDFTLVTT